LGGKLTLLFGTLVGGSEISRLRWIIVLLILRALFLYVFIFFGLIDFLVELPDKVLLHVEQFLYNFQFLLLETVDLLVYFIHAQLFPRDPLALIAQ
jgi:hypothetical protein